MFDLEKKRLIGNTGLSVSPIAFGCWGICSPEWGSSVERAEICKILNAAWEAGINLFDTAAVYGDGLGESIFASISWKNEAILATKVSARRRPAPPIKSIKEYYSPGHITRAVERSLHRMRRQYIDVVQLHNWYEVWEPEANYVFNELQALKQQGKIRAIGLSFPDWSAASISNLLARHVIDVVQAPLNLFQQWAIEQVIKPAQSFNVGVFARSPLDHGSLATLSGRIETLSDTDFRKLKFAGDRVHQLRARIQHIYDLTGITEEQLPFYAIAYCLAQPGITSVIVGMRTLNHVKQNTTLSNYRFSSHQLERGKCLTWERGW